MEPVEVRVPARVGLVGNPSDGYGGAVLAAGGVALDRRTRMMYDERHVFINGEGYRASGRDARLMRRLADERSLGADPVARLSEEAQSLLAQWKEAGWLHGHA